MANDTDVGMAASFDEEIAAEGEAVSIYHPSRTVTTGNPAESPVSLAGTTTGMFQFNEAAADFAGLLGIDPGQVCQLFILSTDHALLTERAWVKDAEDQPWLAASRPVSQRLSGTVIGCNAMLRWSPDKPQGMS